MRHECIKGGRTREMGLAWTCSCGEEIPFEEFTQKELDLIEYLLNKHKKKLIDTACADSAIEKVRKM